MPKYKTDIDSSTGIFLNEPMVRQLYDRAQGIERVLVSLCWKTGARTNELTQLKKEDAVISEDDLALTLHTEKLGASKEFVLRQRTLNFARPSGVGMDIYTETIVMHCKNLANGEPILKYGDRWVQKRLNILGIKVFGKPICLYHFRHAAMTREANRGHGAPDLMHFKGAKSPRSVEGYLHATPYQVK